ncbi:polyketide antibiotic transporter [Microbacterium sp. NPDC077663]|uniref:polyketide antibiotic transporter n=1 Tax=Microbacterium sp. NPDC077663 TaxID=3364189 RepID=UPI0037C71350
MMTLLALRLRRDRVQLLLWILGAAALAAASAAGIDRSFGTEADRRALLAAALANPVILLFRGLPSGSGMGAFLAFLVLPFLALMAALMSAFLVVRHTRAEEEAGRAELVAATRAGRLAPLAATLFHGALANVVFGAVVAASLITIGLDAAGSVLSGLAAAATGLAFVGVAAVAAQLARTARTASAISVWAILLTYLLCGIGNAAGTPSADLQRMESGWLTWLSPFGWAENVRPYDADDPTPLLLTGGLTLVTVGVAVALHRARDLGEGILPERKGRAEATRGLRGSTALAWRLSRGAVLGWVVGALLSGALSTRLASVISGIAGTIPSLEAVVRSLASQGSLAQSIVTVFFALVGILAAAAGVQTVLRARQEEARGTAEAVRAGALGRARWMSSWLLVAALAILVVAAAAVAGAAVGLLTQADADWTLMRDAAVTATGQALAASVVAILAAAVFVVLPRATIPAGWGLLAVATIVGLFGPIVGLPEQVVDASPFAAAPTLSGDEIDGRGIVWLLAALAAGLVIVFTAVRRRELHPDG